MINTIDKLNENIAARTKDLQDKLSGADGKRHIVLCGGTGCLSNHSKEISEKFREVLADRPDITLFASPWSPPGWMKSNASMKQGGRLRERHYQLWESMIARFVAEYRALGIPVTRLTIQNEPEATQTWESCRFTAKQERVFLRDHLKPALRAAGLVNVKVLGWDHNKERLLDRASAIMADPASAADLDCMAFHWYSGDHFEAVRATRELIGARRELIFTEGCEGYSAGNAARELPHAEHYAHEIIGDLEAGANGIIDWNILLDQHG
jgi:glucosylceramidase